MILLREWFCKKRKRVSKTWCIMTEELRKLFVGLVDSNYLTISLKECESTITDNGLHKPSYIRFFNRRLYI